MTLLREAQDLKSLLETALGNPQERGGALRLLLILGEKEIREHVKSLIRIASVGHSDIALAREVILRLDKDWLLNIIESHVAPVLETGGEEEFRRLAELFKLVDTKLLHKHLEQCAAHPSPEVREIASDF